MPATAPVITPDNRVYYALAVLEPLNLEYESAYIRAVIALIDEIVDQIENPQTSRSSIDPDLYDVAYAAAELRKVLENTRDAWDLARIAELDRKEKENLG